MDSAVAGTLTGVLYQQANVLPSARVRPNESIAPLRTVGGTLGFVPGRIDPLQAAGGFNSVVELSAGTCLGSARNAMANVPLDETLAPADLTALAQTGASDGPLAAVGQMLPSLPADDYRGFRLTLNPDGLSFPDAHTVVIAFAVQIDFVRAVPLLPPPGNPWRNPAWRIPIPDPALFGSHMPEPTPYAMAFERSAPIEPRAMSFAERLPAGGGRVAGTTGAVENLAATPIGGFRATLEAPIKHVDDVARCRSRAFADLRQAQWTETPPPAPQGNEAPSDLRLVYEACFAHWIDQASQLIEGPLDLPLSPTISLVGRNAAGAAVPEIPDCVVHVFPVQAATSAQALVFAFETAAKCHGVDASVQHFIGPYPYGVISDEYIVGGVLHHKWNRGGFDRSINIQNNTQVKVKRNGHEGLEDATVFGYEELDTLDTVAITTESNTRQDYIKLGGQAEVVATSLRMAADGQTFGPGDVDLGPVQAAQWGFLANVDLNRPLESDPELRDTQLKAEHDGTRHLARPFAFFADSGAGVQVVYSRVEGVSKQVFFLGDVDPTLA
jgi:hypothetical protein